MLSSVCKAKASHSDLSSSARSVASREIEQFSKEPLMPLSGDPLVWWKSKQFKYPYLAKIALGGLVVQGTSVPSERLFSKAGELISNKRASLLPENVDKLLFLNQNINLHHK